MLGLVIRALPFWVREPLLIAFGIPFSGFLFYVAARDGDWRFAALGAVMLVFTAVRIHTVTRAFKARRLIKEMAATRAAEGQGLSGQNP
jgi:hypothetical protein